MEIQNTLENKAKFFALYLGQKVLFSEDEYLMIVGLHSATWRYDIKNYKLLLKPLSQTTDEDAIKVFDLVLRPNHDYIKRLEKADFIKQGRSFVNSLNTEQSCYMLSTNLVSKGIDFLRSKGYALPYMGISVEQ